MSDDRFPVAEEKGKYNYLKKFAAPVAVASVCGAAALLYASGKTDSPLSSVQLQQNFLSMSNVTDSGFKGENCSNNFERLHEENDSNFIGSYNMTSNLHDGMYRDPSFPADESSLYWKMQTASQQLQALKEYKKVQRGHPTVWVRPRDLLNSTPNPGRNHPSLYGPKGVQVRTSEQRFLGDCWFLSSATAVAETPSRIHDIFNNIKDYNANGAFQMFFYVRGEKVAVHIDDRIPLTKFGPGYNSYYYWLNNAPSQDGAWWLVLLEKAFAKLNVNYANINGGQAKEALKALTGAPVVTYQSKALATDNDLLWKIVTEGMNKNYPMVGCTSSNTAFDVAHGHCETCIGSLILKNPDGSEHAKLIKMRNPWGHYQYDGPWSNKSDLWTPEFKKQADFGDADDGIFYTPVEDWTSEFEYVSVAHTEDWKVDSIEGKTSTFASQGANFINETITFSNPVKQDVFVECYQYTARLWPYTDDKQCHGEEGHPSTYFQMVNTEGANSQKPMFSYSQALECNGDSFFLKDLAPGQYNIPVNNLGEAKTGNSIFALRTYAQTVKAPLKY